MKGFRKNFTAKEYKRYLENMAKTNKYLHDGLESYEVERGVKEGRPESKELRRRNARNRRFKMNLGKKLEAQKKET